MHLAIMRQNQINVSIALSDNVNTRPVIDGRVRPQGVQLCTTVLHPSEMFWRQLKYQEFDVSEMSLSSLLISWANGNRDWVAIPVFTSRHFFHTWALKSLSAGIDHPRDLKGKRVGVPEYQQTAAIWSRGVLQHEFGVAPDEIQWFMERGTNRSHGAATSFTPPKGVEVVQIAADADIGSMMLKGELDATLLHLNGGNLVDRSRTELNGAAAIRPLFDDVGKECRRYYRKTNLYPINHTLVMRRSIHERHPWLALNLFKAFQEAKKSQSATSSEILKSYVDTGAVCSDLNGILERDPAPYGLVHNRTVLETIARYVHEQGLTEGLVPIDAVFAPSTLDI